MKRALIGILVVIAAIGLAACEDKKEPEVTTVVIESGEVTPEPENLPALQNDEMYKEVIDEYKISLASYDLEDLDAEEKLLNEFGYVNPALIMHIARYQDTGAELTFDFYDIDKNEIDELIVGVSGAPTAIYSYDEVNKVPVKIYFLETIERGSLNIYDNGIINSEGAGGAALHYYEFGRISSDGLGFESLEKIEEEYVDGNEVAEYRNAETGDKLDYNSMADVFDKYNQNPEIVGL